MIDWAKSAELNGCMADDLKARFERFPNSEKLVWWVCEGDCGVEKARPFRSCYAMCRPCSKRTLKFRENARQKSIEQFSDPEAKKRLAEINKEYWSIQANRDAQSVRKTQFYIDNPEAVDDASYRWSLYWADQNNRNAQSDRLIEYFSNQNVRDKHSEIITNSEAAKIQARIMRGGYDIIDHHIIYDHNEPTRNIVRLSRSVHTMLHRLFQKHKIEIPHINVTEENKHIFKGRNTPWVSGN